MNLHLRDFAKRAFVPVTFLILWQAASAAGLITSGLIPSPVSIAAAFSTLAASGELALHICVSLLRAAAGLAIGLTLGTAAAVVSGLSTRGEEAIDSSLQMIRTLPHLALVPLFILWFGIGETPKVLLVALGAFFPLYMNLFAGIRNVDPKLVEAARVFSLSGAKVIRYVILPGAMPQALVGLRYAMGVAWLSLVVAEQINATSGIGFLINNAREFLQIDVIFVGLIVYALLGLFSDLAVRTLERRLLAWRPSYVK